MSACTRYLPDVQADSLDALLQAMDAEAYEASDGSYAHLPTWGPQTPRVQQLMLESGPHGDLVSWDTRAADAREHRYLRRTWTPAASRPHYFWIETEEEWQAVRPEPEGRA
jgi:hypothetical protein